MTNTNATLVKIDPPVEQTEKEETQTVSVEEFKALQQQIADMQSQRAAPQVVVQQQAPAIGNDAHATYQQQANFLQSTAGTEVLDPNSPDIRTYYSRFPGSRYCFQDGGVAIFGSGKYKIDAANPANARRVMELETVCGLPSSPQFSRVPVALHISDARLMKEVGGKGGAVANSGVGMLGSIAGMGNLAESNG